MTSVQEGKLSGLYVDEGKTISTHSMLKTFRRCPRQAYYKYYLRLKPKEIGKHLHRGKWIHALLEKFHTGEDWREEHERWTHQFSKLFEEEQERLGDLPRLIDRVMRAYIWHYAADEWEVQEVEFKVETPFPDGTVYRFRVDMLVRNQFGLWLVDHKSHAKLPDHAFRLLDAQSALYVWGALREKYGVEGFIWNYIKWKPPTVPKVLKSGGRFARENKLDTDYPTMVKAIKRAGFDPEQYRDRLKHLFSLRYEPGEPQLSNFFRRDALERQPAMLKRVATENYATSQRMHAYDFSKPDRVERVVDRSCTFMCSYTDLCTMELLGAGNVDLMKRKLYVVGDPLDYYHDDKIESRNS